MTATNHAEPVGFDALAEMLESFCRHAYDGLIRISLKLDQVLGAEMTTALAVILGVLSLVLALFPLWSLRRKPSAKTLPTQDPVQRDFLGEEIVQMHPECLQTLYGISAVSQDVSASPVQPAAETVIAPPERAPERGNDLPLGLIADLSEELTQQHKTMLALQRLNEQQQLQIQVLTAQMKAQSSAFLLQGERLLRLEAISEKISEASPQENNDEDMQRLSIFDQAIELAGQGVSAEVLMSRCGLSVSEARLVVLVHGKQVAD